MKYIILSLVIIQFFTLKAQAPKYSNEFLHLGVGAETHDRAVAELFGDGGEGELDVFLAGLGDGSQGRGGSFGGSGFGHGRWGSEDGGFLLVSK